MTSTATLRMAWAPHCSGPFARIKMHGEGYITVRASTVDAWLALNQIFIRYNYTTRKEDTGAYNCRPITGGSAYSLHAYAIASDFNWLTNPYGKKLITDMPIEMIEDIEAIRTNSGRKVFRWGGRYSGNKDAMHFEIICTPAQLATGIDPSTVRVGDPPTPPKSEKNEGDITMEAALLLVKIHYDNIRGKGKRTYDVEKSDPGGFQSWVQLLLETQDAGGKLSDITNQLAMLLLAREGKK